MIVKGEYFLFFMNSNVIYSIITFALNAQSIHGAIDVNFLNENLDKSCVEKCPNQVSVFWVYSTSCCSPSFHLVVVIFCRYSIRNDLDLLLFPVAVCLFVCSLLHSSIAIKPFNCAPKQILFNLNQANVYDAFVMSICYLFLYLFLIFFSHLSFFLFRSNCSICHFVVLSVTIDRSVVLSLKWDLHANNNWTKTMPNESIKFTEWMWKKN